MEKDELKSREQYRAKLEELLRRKQQVETDKKTATTAYNDELAEIGKEVKSVLDDIDKIVI